MLLFAVLLETLVTRNNVQCAPSNSGKCSSLRSSSWSKIFLITDEERKLPDF